jgi:uncharacterized protein (TIGR04145 family)
MVQPKSWLDERKKGIRSKRVKKQKIFAFLMAIVLLCATLPITAFSAEVDSVSASGNGETISLTFGGNSWWVQQDLVFQYADGTTETYIVCVGNGTLYVKDQSWADVPVTGSSDYSSGDGAYTATVSIPVSLLKSTDVTGMTFFGTSFSAQQLGLSASDGSAGEPDNEGDSDNSGETDNDGEIDTDDETDNGDEADSNEPAGDTALTPTVSGKITVDGSLDDWASVTQLASSENKVDYWKIAQDTEGNVYLCFTGTAVSQWDGDYQWKALTITQNGSGEWLQIANLQSIGATVVTDNQANGNSSAPYSVEVMIPASYFTDPNFTISFAGSDMTSSTIPVLDGTESADKAPAEYNGIVIDGKYSDWDAVVKESVSEPGGNLDQAAMVFDGDYVYIYLHETSGGSAEAAGSHGNGNYVLTTDLGRQLLFQLRDGAVSGVEGASASHVGAQWEIAIPASALPTYQQSISFGLYQQDAFVSDVSNLNGSGGTAGTFDGIVIDGQYEDWDSYPHQQIDYSTAGTQAGTVDSEGAIYAQDNVLYGHVVTNMQSHLDTQGADFLSGISIAFNGDRDYKSTVADGNFYPSFILAEEADGTYTYYIWDARLPYDANMSKDDYFGTMIVTVNGTCDEMEFELDLEKVAALSGTDANSLQQIDVQFGRFGQQWLSTAGASSGPWLGVALCLAVVGGIWIYRKRKTGVNPV